MYNSCVLRDHFLFTRYNYFRQDHDGKDRCVIISLQGIIHSNLIILVKICVNGTTGEIVTLPKIRYNILI